MKQVSINKEDLKLGFLNCFVVTYTNKRGRFVDVDFYSLSKSYTLDDYTALIRQFPPPNKNYTATVFAPLTPVQYEVTSGGLPAPRVLLPDGNVVIVSYADVINEDGYQALEDYIMLHDKHALLSSDLLVNYKVLLQQYTDHGINILAEKEALDD